MQFNQVLSLHIVVTIEMLRICTHCFFGVWMTILDFFVVFCSLPLKIFFSFVCLDILMVNPTIGSLPLIR